MDIMCSIVINTATANGILEEKTHTHQLHYKTSIVVEWDHAGHFMTHLGVNNTLYIDLH